MKYRICKNGNGKYKIEYKRRWTLCWFDFKKKPSWSRHFHTVIFNTIEKAEKEIVFEKKKNELKRKSHENDTRNKTWSCMGEY